MGEAKVELHQAQQTDYQVSKVLEARTQSTLRPTGPKQTLQRHSQLRSQLRVVDGTLCGHFAPSPT